MTVNLYALAAFDWNNTQQKLNLESLICSVNASVYPWCVISMS